MKQAFTGADVFDGATIARDACLVVEAGHVLEIADKLPKDAREIRLNGGTLAPGFLDLQVNGGGGVMVDGQTTADSLARLCALHAGLGATGILPTLITDTPKATARVIAAGIAAAKAKVPGFLGLHLEGPHLDPRRKGAHDARMIRPMTDADLALYLDAAAQLPSLMLTVAPASATSAQIAALSGAGVIVSLGHSEATHAEAQAAIAAGARAATHLFNAMSPLGNRDPGMVGAILSCDLAAGIIADGYHVAVPTLKIALAARPRGLYLVSDCMAAAGSDLTEFTLGGRRILRRDGRLTLEDGTLAGADLTLAQAVKVMVDRVGLPLAQALAMVTVTPAALLRRGAEFGHLNPGMTADLVYLDPGLQLAGVWRAGQQVAVSA
ncbi:MAG: N-acetylglucosamine-6-phosphate deacetylase [Pseudorhodobacter sp.]|nr:MAG: N-acetylglucosamine-6-phosphate deacetylase [Pseudorhodobacter sp.]